MALAVSQLVEQFTQGQPHRVTRIGGRFAAMVFMPSTIETANQQHQRATRWFPGGQLQRDHRREHIGNQPRFFCLINDTAPLQLSLSARPTYRLRRRVRQRPNSGKRRHQYRSACNQALPLSWNLERKRANELDTTSANVDAVLDHIFTDTATQAVVISKRGYVIGERYADGYDNNSLGTSWSVAKSFYSALMGIAMEEGWIQSTEQRASEFLTEWSDSDKADITIAQILSMRSGYDGNDQVFFQNDQTEYAINLPSHHYQESALLIPMPTHNLWSHCCAAQPAYRPMTICTASYCSP